MLRGFRGIVTGDNPFSDLEAKEARFNTPEGVEGFSSWDAIFLHCSCGSVSIPRRVLRGFRGHVPSSPESADAFNRFNTPEGVEGFSSVLATRSGQLYAGPAFQYPGGC